MLVLLTFVTFLPSLHIKEVYGQTLLGGSGGAEMSLLNPIGSGIFVTPVTEPPCNLRPHPLRHMYEEFIPGFDWTARFCPPGTLYSSEACACHNIDLSQVYVCKPELLINFDGNKIDDSSGNQISVAVNENVVNYQNAGQFDGSGTLSVVQYSKQSFGTKLTIKLRFYEQQGSISNEQVLISNCIGGRSGSVEIALNQPTNEVVFRVETKTDSTPEYVELRQTYKEGEWKNVTMVYDGNTVTARVGENTVTAPLQGNIATRYNGIMIGSCHGRGYVGYIDDVRLYRCLE